MNKNIKNLFCGLFISSLLVADTLAASARSGVNVERGRAAGAVSTRSNPRANVSPRASSGTVRVSRPVNVARTAVLPRSEETGTLSRAAGIISEAGNALIRRAFGTGRSATVAPKSTVARSATTTNARAARPVVTNSASRARATAVFGDISKLGEGYNTCREAYSTCMDQFCAGANDTYRRCFCSDVYRDLRDKEEALDAAAAMLANFENNNLNAVDKTAEEVNAMYSATVGEAAIKKDTSASAKLLDDIGDLLSGKKKAEPANKSMATLSMDLTFSSDIGDIWADNSSSSLFGDAVGGDPDLSQMEGLDLYNNAHNQCLKLVANQCEAGPVRNMIKSAYSIFITQDCNAYQKKLSAKTEQLKTTVRTAEKYLREARLEEYRSHNSADVNECMDKVEKAILAPTACGEDFVKCLDPTGVYINTSTGEPIYSPRLFKLNEVIVLDGESADVLKQNKPFDDFLDSKRIFAKSALDSCRSIADTVWSEFKRSALIKISQAQDEKIEEVKMSCVSTMKECYDTQSGALKSFDDTTAQASGALAARAAKDMCVDKVAACAALYAKEGDEECKVDKKTGKITNGDACGLASLRNFVDNVDDVRIAEGCDAAVKKYLEDLCTPTSGEDEYPWNCRLKRFNGSSNAQNPLAAFGRRGSVSSSSGSNAPYVDLTNVDGWDYRKGDNSTVAQMVVNYAFENCGTPVEGGRQVGANSYTLETRSRRMVARQIEDVQEALGHLMGEKCGNGEGLWVDASETAAGGLSMGNPLDSFYSVTFGANHDNANNKYGVDSWGVCVKNDVQARCRAENTRRPEGAEDWATYDPTTGVCSFTSAYFQDQCSQVRGTFIDGMCYVDRDPDTTGG